MFILSKDRPTNSFEEWETGWNRYQNYLDGIAEQLPIETLRYARAEWHYNHFDHRAPHDAWLEKLEIFEEQTGERRSLVLRALLLGAYHDGRIKIEFRNVVSYTLNCQKPEHGDWLYDEVRLSNRGLVLHEVEFNNGSWLIECESLVYDWLPHS